MTDPIEWLNIKNLARANKFESHLRQLVSFWDDIGSLAYDMFLNEFPRGGDPPSIEEADRVFAAAKKSLKGLGVGEGTQ